MQKKLIGERLKYIRKLQKMNQTDLSEKLGISQGTLSEIESGKILPSLEVIMKLADTYKLDLNWLIANSSDKSTILQDDEFEVITAYRQLQEIAKQEVLDYLEIKLKRFKNPKY
jgi:transcriptional regulator with XRE-family HTH domain